MQEQVMVQEKVEIEEQQTSLEAELSFEDVQGDRSEEDRLTEAEKNERQRKMLQVWMLSFEWTIFTIAAMVVFIL